MKRPGSPALLIRHADDGRWLWFREPLRVHTAHRLDEVLPVLAEVEAAVGRGAWAAGFLAYEAAPAFDPALAAHPSGPLPLAWWGIFREPRAVARPGDVLGSDRAGADLGLDWRPTVDRSTYGAAVAAIRRRIAAGDTYQVNYTFPLETPLTCEPPALFAALQRAQGGRYGAYLDLGRFAVCSASPELFFALDGERIVTRPMKGTARRGRFPEEDARRARALRSSAKNRAENVMIVDMLRNDLGKIARPGSVRTGELFAVERYPTVHQLTSTVRAITGAPWVEVLTALFPCASITGAPKVGTSRLIREIEAGPRGVYTGAIGFLAPGRRCQLNVAIRTATVDRLARRVRYGTGGGIVWSSKTTHEHDECRAKALILTSARPPFSLLETLAWRPRRGGTGGGAAGRGYFLLERHLRRVAASARYFDVPLKIGTVRRRLLEAAAAFEPVRHRVRLLVGEDGRLEIAAEPWPCAGRTRWSVRLDDRPTDSSDPFLFHKTTRREVYDRARARFPEVDEVVLWNERGELTEATRANLVLRLGDELLTPPVRSGLLAGTYRAELLARGRLRERVLPVALFDRADEVLLINSLRGFIRTRHQTGPPRPGRERRRLTRAGRERRGEALPSASPME